MIPVYQGEEAQNWLSRLTGSDSRRSLWREMSVNPIEATVREIIDTVAADGDTALTKMAERFQEWQPGEALLVADGEIEAACQALLPETRKVLDTAAANIRAFAERILALASQPGYLHHAGFSVGYQIKPVARAGCYVPGGRYPLASTALMTAITAQVAGVPDIVMACPRFTPEILYAGRLAGVSRFYRMGGAQAVAALALGTESIAPVDMVVGPGNAYVTEAKRQLQGLIGIDMLAGPSEVVTVADAGANPDWVALDLLAQAEHDPDARCYCFTDSATLAQTIAQAVPQWIDRLTLPAFLKKSLLNSAIVVLDDLAQCVEAANAVAPEHLQLHLAEPEPWLNRLDHFGALFIGYDTTVPYGDYLAGPNHTLPTQRTARFAGALSPLTFLRTQTWVQASPQAQDLARDTATFARLEGLTAHAMAAEARLVAT
jgi:histidinol dehydrogenase